MLHSLVLLICYITHTLVLLLHALVVLLQALVLLLHAKGPRSHSNLHLLLYEKCLINEVFID